MISFEKIRGLNGEITVPSDKSMTHRAFIFGAMAKGKTVVKSPLLSRDTIATKDALVACGVDYELKDGDMIINSKGYDSFLEPDNVINCENSGTTARLLTGLFAPQSKYFFMTGDNSLRKRPMKRVIDPLSNLGAVIHSRRGFLPLMIQPSSMKGGIIEAKVKSAQVKSAVILAGLQIDEPVTYIEKDQTRDHTEQMLKYFGVNLDINNGVIEVNKKYQLKSTEFTVPGDFSSAAFFIGAALMFENSEVVIKNVGLNKTRTGLLKILNEMGAKIDVLVTKEGDEPIGDISIKFSSLNGGVIRGEIIPNIIDEIPLLGALGLFAKSPIEIRDAEELRVKESDRIKSIVYNLRVVGAEVEEYEDGFKVYPMKKVNDKGVLKSFDDHRIAMINILLSKRFGNFDIDSIESIDVSFPDFLERLKQIEIS
ncbi:3-phosphoshikimate 1-carboxyvinyltransferase [Deferribacter desulfuricans SSM1]|uniref:3-phosphoshikimate 1-carboxyvinyltransferase n=1 Tax=Deferribacter desulfuricans (strain DSM 14783 / JCM 11476 / NBRC 101012 / SSM1) TaxID=639282 RepID=D3PA06_DEFDS|nr:3-phosphoshikimate 1-carboxyvinyltransferase [Deferribacter desulfuricans]BAI81546.1 3-phosphoshikimate 1-carboxyvinyltransferase [Deferribacter desulfuricans SSM1]